MALELSTAGIKVKYCIGTSASHPTSGFTQIPEVKSIPSLGNEVNALQTTPLDATANHTYIEGLADPGGAISLTVNDCESFRSTWEALMTAYASMASTSAVWIEYAIPGLTDSLYYKAIPCKLGFGGAEVDSVLENTANLMPQSDFEWDTKSN